MFYKIREDIFRLRSSYRLSNIVTLWFSSRGFQAICLFRCSNYLYNKGFIKFSIIFKNISIAKTGCEIGEGAIIGTGIKIGHPVGIVVSGKCSIGNNVTIQSGVVLGVKNNACHMAPTLGKNVYISAGAKILGGITIGDNVVIGANAVVLNNIPDNAVVVGMPGRVIKSIN